MEHNGIRVSRRKAIAALGTVGAVSVAAGTGTSAFFSDTEEFEDNQLVAGELDVRAGYEAHYSDWSPDEDVTQGMDFLTATTTGAVTDDSIRATPDDDGDGLVDAFTCQSHGTISTGRATIILNDVKPGDFGFLNVDLLSCTNPAYLWMNTKMNDSVAGGPNAENGVNEAEASDENEDDEPGQDDPNASTGGELANTIRVRPYYIDPGVTTTGRSTEGMAGFFDAVSPLSGSNISDTFFDVFDLANAPTLMQFATAFDPTGTNAPGLPLDGEPGTDDTFGMSSTNSATDGIIPIDIGADDPTDFPGSSDPTQRDCLPGTTEYNSDTAAKRYVGLAWGLTVDHANEIQGDSTAFDVGFYAEQCRHNDGSGRN